MSLGSCQKALKIDYAIASTTKRMLFGWFDEAKNPSKSNLLVLLENGSDLKATRSHHDVRLEGAKQRYITKPLSEFELKFLSQIPVLSYSTPKPRKKYPKKPIPANSHHTPAFLSNHPILRAFLRNPFSTLDIQWYLLRRYLPNPL